MRAFLTLTLLALTACQIAPPIAARRPWFETERDLSVKAARLEESTRKLIDPAGLLLYRARLPLDKAENAVDSHDIADAPAWQGYLLAAEAFAEAAGGGDRDAEIDRLAGGLERFYEVTGVRGLFGRSMTPDYKGPRRPWMETEELRPTKYWMRGPTGAWWRNGLAKGHLSLACFGLSIPLTLDRRGDIELEEATRARLIRVLLPAVRRLVSADFDITDWNGEPTEFGGMGPQVGNGFNMLLTLHMLCSAAPYDDELKKLYEDRGRRWATLLGLSLEGLGEVVLALGHHRFGKPSYSDMQLAALAGCSILLQETRRAYTKDIKKGLRGLWEYVRYERNAPFTLVYNALVRPGSEPDTVREILEDLRDFPVDKRARRVPFEDTDTVQPLANRPLNTNYWKSSPYRRVTGPAEPPAETIFGGQDYLLAYWMGRYFELIPER